MQNIITTTIDGQRLTIIPNGLSPLSNTFLIYFRHHDRIFNCVEQLYQFEKATYFRCYDTAEAIYAERDPVKQKILGASIRNFSFTHWANCIDHVMEVAILAKFNHHKQLKKNLLITNDDIIADCSSTGNYWGTGLQPDSAICRDPLQWPGSNKLGEILMKVRTIFETNSYEACKCFRCAQGKKNIIVAACNDGSYDTVD